MDGALTTEATEATENTEVTEDLLANLASSVPSLCLCASVLLCEADATEAERATGHARLSTAYRLPPTAYFPKSLATSSQLTTFHQAPM
jgi:hypothetical protein